MPSALIQVDAGHLLACAGRAAGVGAAAGRGRLSLDALLEGLLDLVPSDHRVQEVRWYDAARPGTAPKLPDAPPDVPVVPVTLPLRAGRQRLVEAAVLRDALFVQVDRLYLLGDPRRHALTLQTVEERGQEVLLVGISDGETTPARRQWLRRPEVNRALRAGERRRRPRVGNDGYEVPSLRSSPVRIPLPPAPASGDEALASSPSEDEH